MTSSLPSRRLLTLCLLAGVAILGISACGSSSSTTSTAVAGTSVSSNSQYQARLALAKCMRAHGVNVPDPSPSGGPPGGVAGLRALQSDPNFQPALQACARYRNQAFGFGNFTPAQQAQFRQDLVRFARCMRSHNIDIPDPSSSNGGPFGIFRSLPSSERNSPAFQAAVKACSSELPQFGNGGPGAPPAPGGVPGTTGA
jgi:hypothetical protein